MDTTKPSLLSSSIAHALSVDQAAVQLHSDDAPLVLDVRKNEAFIAANATLPGALRRDPLLLDVWADALPASRAVLVYCVHGHEVSHDVMRELRSRGMATSILVGGFEAWRAAGLPLTPKATGSATRWVTRERPKIDRLACPWLVRRFVDDQALFWYVPPAQVRSVADAQNAMPYDVNANVADTAFTHDGAQCSFDAFIRIYRLGSDTALARLADIVRGADTDQLYLAPQAAGLLAVSLGMSRRLADDHTLLEAMMPVYDALYAWCRDAVARTDEKHNWKPA
jgi:rhodanese-related sulfurtransferase